MPPKSAKPAQKGLTKAETLAAVAEKTGLTKKQVTEVMDGLSEVLGAELKKGNPGIIPGLAKIVVTRKPATPAGPGTNPFTGLAIMKKAKPAHNVVKLRAIKALKDMV